MKDIILEQYEVRKTNTEKTKFIEYIKTRLSQAGYDIEKDIKVEKKGKGSFLSRNIIVGDPAQADVIFTAHYDTCAVLPFPNLMSPTNVVLFVLSQVSLVVIIFMMAFVFAFVIELVTKGIFDSSILFLVFLYGLLFHMLFGYMNKHTANDNTSGVITITRILEALPTEYRKKICVVYFDNEEKGLLGSDYFKTKHKKDVEDKLLLNFDCVGDGENIVFLAKKHARKDKKYQDLVEVLAKCAQNHDVVFMNKKMKFMMFGSDQMYFDKGVGICALRKSPVGMYVARIHTPFDTKCREENISYLVDGMIRYLTQ